MTRHSPDAEQANDMWMRYDTDNDDKTRHLSHDDMMMDLKQMKIYMIEKKTPPRSKTIASDSRMISMHMSETMNNDNA